MLRKSLFAASAAFALSAAAPAGETWAACKEVVETYYGKPVWAPVPTQKVAVPPYAGYENAGGSPVLGGEEWIQWGVQGSQNDPKGGSWGIWNGASGASSSGGAGGNYGGYDSGSAVGAGGNYGGYSKQEGGWDVWVTTTAVHLNPHPSHWMGNGYHGETWKEYTVTCTNTLGVTSVQYGPGGGWEVWATVTTGSNGVPSTMTVTATTTATVSATITGTTTSGGATIGPILTSTTPSSTVSFTTTTISSTLIISPVTTSTSTTTGGNTVGPILTGTSSTTTLSFTTTTSSGTVVISPVTTSTSSSTTDTNTVGPILTSTTSSTTLSFTTTTSSGTVIISPITTSTSSSTSTTSSGTVITSPVTTSTSTSSSTTTISFTTTTSSGTVVISPVTTSTSSTTLSTITITSTSSTTTASSTSSTTSSTTATGPCATFTSTYVLQGANTGDFAVDGNYVQLSSAFGSGYIAQFSANRQNAQQFKIQPDCSLTTSDGNLLAMIGGTANLHNQYFFPSVQAASALVNVNWEADVCTVNADNTLTCTAMGQSIFQVTPGQTNLELGDQNYGEQVTVNLIPVPGSVF